MEISDRVRNILINPNQEWQIIKDEHATTAGLFKEYVMPLAAIPAIAGFFGAVFIGYPVLNRTYRMAFFDGLGQAIIGYVLTFIMLYLLSIILEKLSPRFDVDMDQEAGLKLVVYSYTPAWIAGIFLLIPSLAWVATLGGLYSIYLLYLGLGVLAATPKEKTLVFTAAVIGAAIILSLVIGLITALLFGNALP